MHHMKRAVAVLGAAVVGALASASVASAQPKMEITPFAGYYIASDLYNSYGTSGYSNVELTNSFMYGVRLTASTLRGGMEFAWTRTGSDAKINNLQVGQPVGDNKVGRLDIDNYDINFIGYQPSGNPRVMPFGLIGFGWAVTHPTIETNFIQAGTSTEGHTLFNFNFGLGTKIEMNPKLSMRLEGRWRVTDTHVTTSSGFWCDPWGYCYSYASDWYNSGELTGGLSYAFR